MSVRKTVLHLVEYKRIEFVSSWYFCCFRTVLNILFPQAHHFLYKQVFCTRLIFYFRILVCNNHSKFNKIIIWWKDDQTHGEMWAKWTKVFRQQTVMHSRNCRWNVGNEYCTVHTKFGRSFPLMCQTKKKTNWARKSLHNILCIPAQFLSHIESSGTNCRCSTFSLWFLYFEKDLDQFTNSMVESLTM